MQPDDSEPVALGSVASDLIELHDSRLAILTVFEDDVERAVAALMLEGYDETVLRNRLPAVLYRLGAIRLALQDVAARVLGVDPRVSMSRAETRAASRARAGSERDN